MYRDNISRLRKETDVEKSFLIKIGLGRNWRALKLQKELPLLDLYYKEARYLLHSRKRNEEWTPDLIT